MNVAGRHNQLDYYFSTRKKFFRNSCLLNCELWQLTPALLYIQIRLLSISRLEQSQLTEVALLAARQSHRTPISRSMPSSPEIQTKLPALGAYWLVEVQPLNSEAFRGEISIDTARNFLLILYCPGVCIKNPLAALCDPGTPLSPYGAHARYGTTLEPSFRSDVTSDVTDVILTSPRLRVVT